MIDRSKALVLALAATFAIILLVTGFAIGSGMDDASSDPNSSDVPAVEQAAPSEGTNSDQGLAMGFPHSDAGALAAAVAWGPWLFSTPADERPAGLVEVVGDEVVLPSDELITQRTQFAPLAARVEVISPDDVTVTLFGPILLADAVEGLAGEFWSFPITLEWDSTASDWRVSAMPTGPSEQYVVETPIAAEDLEGFVTIRPTGTVPGPPILEAVPGE